MCSSQSPRSQPFDVSSISKPSSVGAPPGCTTSPSVFLQSHPPLAVFCFQSLNAIQGTRKKTVVKRIVHAICRVTDRTFSSTKSRRRKRERRGFSSACRLTHPCAVETIKEHTQSCNLLLIHRQLLHGMLHDFLKVLACDDLNFRLTWCRLTDPRKSEGHRTAP